MARQVHIVAPNVQLPNGLPYVAGQTVILTDDEFARISPTALGDEITDLGPVSITDAVVTQAVFVAAPAALTSSAPAAVTSSQVATANGSDAGTTQTLANALKVAYNAAQVDIAALRATLAATQADVAALRTTQAALLVALKGLNKPMATS